MARRKIFNKDYSDIVNALLFIVIGVLFIVLKRGSLEWILRVAGILFIVRGVLELMAGLIFPAAISLILGVALVFGSWLFMTIILIVFGVLMIIEGLSGALKTFRPLRLIPFLFCIAEIVVGVMLVLGQWITVDIFYVVLGVLFIVSGVIDLVSGVKVKKITKR